MTDTSVLPVNVDGLMRVYVDGVEASWSPVFSTNGPFPATVPADPLDEDSTLNFVFIPPESDDVVLSVHVNPPGPNFVPEGNLANNVTSTASLSFVTDGPVATGPDLESVDSPQAGIVDSIYTLPTTAAAPISSAFGILLGTVLLGSGLLHLHRKR